MSRRRILAGTAAALCMLLGMPARGQAPAAAPAVEPVLGLPASDARLIGSSDADTWALGRVTGAVHDASGRPIAVGADGAVLLRHGAGGTWQLVSGLPLDDFRPVSGPGFGRVTPAGAVVLVGVTKREGGGDRPVVVVREPGAAQARVLPDPPADDPATPADDDTAVLHDGEALASASQLALAAVDGPDGTGVYLAAQGPGTQTAIIHFDGDAWTREPIDVPPDSTGSFTVRALDAAGRSGVWLLAREASGANRGVALFRRESEPDGPHWEAQPVTGSVLARNSDGSAGVSDVTPLAYPAQALTATTAGAWVDGTLRAGGVTRDFTAYYDADSTTITDSFCDATGAGRAVCDHPFGAHFSQTKGYRSFAWPGGGAGSRVITNALEPPDGSDVTNRGTWLRYTGAGFERRPGPGGNKETPPGGAFTSADAGWLAGGSVFGHVTTQPSAANLVAWPTSFRRPLLAVAPEPGTTPADIAAKALAVGPSGTVARYTPGQGWVPEFLLDGTGTRQTPRLRGVAWPVADRAYAVGDNGAMWLWRGATGLWERDEAAPLDFVGNLMGVAFDPANGDRGYAVGQDGVLLRYDKTWTQETLPDPVARADLTSISFAGSQALVAAGSHLLTDDGSGWRVDPDVDRLLSTVPNATISTVSGLPDGGAVAAGFGVVLERDHAGAAWRLATPPAGLAAVAVAAVRAGDAVRAVLSAYPSAVPYPAPYVAPLTDPGQPQPQRAATELPQDGFLLRETDAGWEDEQHTAFIPSGNDLPGGSEPVLALLLGADGAGWALGGETAQRFGSLPAATVARVQTTSIQRYRPGGVADADRPAGLAAASVPLSAGTVRFAIGGHALCASPCADLANQDLGPDRDLATALGRAGSLAKEPGGPRAFLYTGGRVDAEAGGLDGSEASRYAQVALSAAGGLPFIPALGSGDGAAGAAGFKAAFADAPGPLGDGGAPAAVDTASIPGAAGAGGARTHYAFDSTGTEGTVRVVVIDNSAGSLAASDPYQNPREPQLGWLDGVLKDAKANGIPAIVLGNRDLNTAAGSPNVATDADAVARLLVGDGASAYFFDRPEENRAYAIPAGAADTIPSFGSGTLGYGTAVYSPDQFFGENGFLLSEIDVAHTDPATNRAPVSVRLIPVIEDLALDATDGTLLRRSRPVLFQALARRPRAGAQRSGFDPGADPYIPIPTTACLGSSACATKIPAEYTFTSSDPDLADFVRHDPASSNPRAVFQGTDGKPVADSSSGLLCAFNAGTTTVTVATGGLSFSEQVTVQAGTAQRPCGTVPLNPSRFKPSQAPSTAVPPGPAQQQQPRANPDVVPPPPPPAAVPAQPAPSVPATKAMPVPLPPLPPALPLPGQPLVQASDPFAALRTVPPPPPPPPARPIPPGGAVARVYQAEREREEEVAPEQSQAYARYEPDHGPPPAALVGVLILGAWALSSARVRPRRRPAPAYVDRRQHRG